MAILERPTRAAFEIIPSSLGTTTVEHRAPIHKRTGAARAEHLRRRQTRHWSTQRVALCLGHVAAVWHAGVGRRYQEEGLGG